MYDLLDSLGYEWLQGEDEEPRWDETANIAKFLENAGYAMLAVSEDDDDVECSGFVKRM